MNTFPESAARAVAECTCSPYFGCSEYAPDCPRHGDRTTVAEFDPALVEKAALTDRERGALQIEIAALHAGHVHMRDVFAVVERIVAAHLSAVAPDLRAEGARQAAQDIETERDHPGRGWNDYSPSDVSPVTNHTLTGIREGMTAASNVARETAKRFEEGGA